MVNVYMMVGVPASGKTTKAKQLALDHNAIVISSDEIRGMLYGNESDQTDPNKVFNILFKKAKEEIFKGNNVIIDATNTKRKNRVNIFEKLRSDNCLFTAYVMSTPIKECLNRSP